MQKIRLLAVILALVACQYTPEISSSEPSDNEELQRLYREDQQDRLSDTINWAHVMTRDSIRELRVFTLLKNHLISTGQDYYHAAMILQHGSDTTASRMAVEMMRQSIELDGHISKWLLAAAIDRNLMRRGQPQIYGTQFISDDRGVFSRYVLDSTAISDLERRQYGVETLAEQREKLKRLNRKQLTALLNSGETSETIIRVIREQFQQEIPEYDISEQALNTLGYQYLGLDLKEAALSIFELNVTLYPNAWNAWDSYGQGLYQTGKPAEAMIAYRKSLKLDSGNTNAQKMIEKIAQETKADSLTHEN